MSTSGTHDIIVRGGTIYDGSGGAPITGDIAVSGGVIAQVGGRIAGTARQEIDADGAIVTPAWVDIHTHYDGQVTWDEEMNPSAGHGVGTVVMGNCGVGFAPVHPGGQRDLIELMEGVEDIPGTALYEGMPWGAWETYPQYLDYLATRKYALDVASLVPHGAVRNYVLGLERGNDNATEAELNQIASIVEDAIRAGAVGFSSSRVMGHRSIHGEPVPGTHAPEVELMAIAKALEKVGSGVLQLIPAGTIGAASDVIRLEDEVEMICRLSAASKRPTTFSLIQTADNPSLATKVIEMVKSGNQAGAQVFAQVGSRSTGFVFSLSSYHPFMGRPSYKEIAHLPLAERAAAMRDAARRARILSETNVAPKFLGSMEAAVTLIPFDMTKTFPLSTDASYEPLRAQSFQGQAEATGEADGWACLYDRLASGDGTAFAIAFFLGYADYDLEWLRRMQLEDVTVIGLSDAGAHVGSIFDGASPTFQLTYWGRDRKRGETIPLAHLINRQTRRNAELFGFHDRGLLKPGLRADLNVVDFKGLKNGEMQFIHDLPAGGGRLMQRAEGYLATVIAGEITQRFDKPTGTRPGRLLRGGGKPA